MDDLDYIGGAMDRRPFTEDEMVEKAIEGFWFTKVSDRTGAAPRFYIQGFQPGRGGVRDEVVKDEAGIAAKLSPAALYVDGEVIWTDLDEGSPEAALMRYFAGIARQQLAKLPDPNAKPALSGLTKTAPGAKHGPGWCDE